MLRRTARLTVCLLTGCVAAVALTAPARADSTDQRVTTLLAQVHQLQTQTDTALGRYQDSLDSVAGAVTTEITSQQRSDAASSVAAGAQQRLDARVRALYMSGGEAGLVSSLLSGDITDLGGRMVAVQRVIAGGRADALDARHKAALADDVAGRAQQRSTASVTTARDILAAAGRLAGLLTQQQQLLDQATAQQASEHARARLFAERARARLRAEVAATQAIAAQRVPSTGPLPASAAYLALYHTAAATCPGLAWQLLAAVGQVESGHGRNVGTSSAGAQGPMQFMPATFAAYAVDGDHDGTTDIMDPADAIFTAAHFLCVHGAGTGPAGVQAALLAYNHAQWYVRLVLSVAADYH